MLRKIVVIDEDKCDGCGLCIPACHEGALQLVDGKARLVSDIYCDGLGDCLGHCPQDAITVEERDAEEFDEEAVKARMEALKQKKAAHATAAAPAPAHEPLPCGCPGTMSRTLERSTAPAPQKPTAPTGDGSSQLTNWPVQLKLIPPDAPYLRNANILFAADCAGFAIPDFHEKFLKGRVLMVGCPKLDDPEPYIAKLARIFATQGIKSVEVLHMEVPCCTGIIRIVREAIARSGASVPVFTTRIGIHGEVQDRKFDV